MKSNICYTPYMIFDMDGTLINSNSELNHVILQYLDRHGVNVEQEFFEQLKTMDKVGVYEEIRGLTKELRPLRETEKELDGLIHDMYCTRVKLIPNAEHYLRILQNYGVRMCVASATESSEVVYVLERLGILKYFDFVLSVLDVGRDKNFPDIYYAAAKQFDCSNYSDITVYEDSPVAMTTAKKAGFHVVAVIGDCDLSEADLNDSMCDMWIKEFGDLL